MSNVNIVVIEDDLAILEILKYNLSKNEGWIVHTAMDGQTGIDLVYEIEPDLIIMDWMLPEKSGIEIIAEVRKHNNHHIPIIMLTAKGEEDDKIKSLRTGADDYVVKPFSPRELDARIKASLRRDSKMSQQLSYGHISINTKDKTIYEQGVLLDIKRKEYDILVYFLMNPNRILSRENILNKIWGAYADVDERTVDVHITRIRKKLQYPKCIESVWGEGYRLVNITPE